MITQNEAVRFCRAPKMLGTSTAQLLGEEADLSIEIAELLQKSLQTDEEVDQFLEDKEELVEIQAELWRRACHSDLHKDLCEHQIVTLSDDVECPLNRRYDQELA